MCDKFQSSTFDTPPILAPALNRDHSGNQPSSVNDDDPTLVVLEAQRQEKSSIALYQSHWKQYVVYAFERPPRGLFGVPSRIEFRDKMVSEKRWLGLG